MSFYTQEFGNPNPLNSKGPLVKPDMSIGMDYISKVTTYPVLG